MRLGIDFGGTNLKTGIFSENGEPVVFVENKLSEFTQKGDVLDNLIRHAAEVSRNYKLTSGGLAIKGLINTETGVLEDDIGAGALLAGKNLKEAFGRELNIPFRVENDARAFAWGEYKFGAGKGSKALVCMTLGTGLGCAVIVDGKPFYGSDVLGGLLGGHISIDRNGDKCPCGSRGCLELYCSATAFIKRIIKAHPEFENSVDVLPEFFNMIEKKAEKYYNTLYSFQDDLALGIVNVIHAYGPDLVVLGGGVLKSARFIIPGVIELVHKQAWTFPREKVEIKVSQLGNKAAAIGIAFLN